jgi:tryptophan-rich sensory protein
MQAIARRGVVSLVVFVMTVAAAATFGAQFSPTSWYENLSKPTWTPPNAMFGPVWTILYVGIAVAGWRVWRRTGRCVAALWLWLAQLVLNACWSLLFFGLHRPDMALVDIVMLLATILGFVFTARRHSVLASWLFVPYAVWVSFASALNYAIVSLN